MKLFSYLSTTLVAISLSTSALAGNETEHTFGFQFGGGDMEYKDQRGKGYGTAYLYYNYQFSPNYYFEAGLLGGVDADWDCEQENGGYNCYPDNDRSESFALDADNLELGALVAAIKTDMNLTERNKLYAKAGVSFYDYDLELNHQKIADKDGVGYMLEAGWEYRWDMGIGANAGLQYHKMGDLDSGTLNIGMSYAF